MLQVGSCEEEAVSEEGAISAPVSRAPGSRPALDPVQPGGTWGRRALRAVATEVKWPIGATLAAAASELLPQFAFSRTRTAILRAAGVHVGDRSLIMGGFRVTGQGELTEIRIGHDTIVTGPVHIDLGAAVTIGDRVHVGHHVVLLTVSHRIGPAAHRCGSLTASPIRIGDGTWIASCVTILPGVSIGEGSVVAAGAVVARDVPPSTMVAGVPAVPVRNLTAGFVEPGFRRSAAGDR